MNRVRAFRQACAVDAIEDHHAMPQRDHFRPGWIVLAVLLPLLSAGCARQEAEQPAISTVPKVQIIHPEVRDLSWYVGQPSFVDAYEQTAIYAKLAGYILKWHVDIGDRVKKDQLLCTLYIPELEEEWNLKKADVVREKALVDQAVKLVEVAKGNLAAAMAQVAEARANVGKFEALVKRWDSEVKRQTVMLKERVLDRQILDESQRQLEASIAARDAANAAVQTAEANRLARAADLDKARVDVEVAQARLQVAEADEKRLAALFSYTRLTAPYDGIIVLRNANTGDFVLPAIGDPSASPRSADQSATKSTPVYVIARTDVVRVYVDVPENQANDVVSQVDRKFGDPRAVTQAKVRVQAFRNIEMPAEVTRASWALNFKSRTLRAEIDLHNPDARLLPGMYAYAMVLFERKNARVLPRAAVTDFGNQTCCYLLQDGKAVRTPLETRPGDPSWVDLVKKQVNGQWLEITGHEDVILGDLSELTDGSRVQVAESRGN